MKAREMMYRESLRISVTNLQEVITPMEEKDRFKKFQEAEKKRYRAEQQRFEMMYRESLRISVTNLQEVITPMEEKDRFKKFQEAEKKRYRAEQQRRRRRGTGP